MSLESLPERPLSRAEYDALVESERVSDTFEFASGGGSAGDYILQFALVLDNGEHVGLQFDPAPERWEVVARTETFEEIATALSESR